MFVVGFFRHQMVGREEHDVDATTLANDCCDDFVGNEVSIQSGIIVMGTKIPQSVACINDTH